MGMSKIAKIADNKKFYDGAALTERMKEHQVCAVSIALVENYKISEACAFGVKRKATKEKLTTDTIFQAASISKPVFAVGVMRLVERGVLDLDTDISEYLVGYEVPPFENKKLKVTLRQLLSHHAGLTLHGFVGYRQGQRIPTVEQILTGTFPANHLKLKHFREPEVGCQYSGGGI